MVHQEAVNQVVVGKQLDQPYKLLMLLGLDQPNLPMLTLLLVLSLP